MKKSKLLRFISMLNALFMTLSTMMFVFVAASAESISYIDDVFTVKTADDLRLVSEKAESEGYYLNKTIKLANDIDLTGEDWDPISIFKGTFDGNGYTIEGLTITCSTAGYAMFNVLDGAVVQNLRLIGSVTQTEVKGSVALLAVTADDTRVGEAKKGVIIENVYVGGTLSTVNNNSTLYGAGFIAYVEADTKLVIEGCASEVNIMGGGKDHAGFVGAAEYGSDVILTDCVFYGYIPNGAKAASGSFLGHVEANVTMTRCLELGYGGERDSTGGEYRGALMYLAFKNYPGSGTDDARETDDPKPEIVIEDCYVTKDTENTSLIGDNGTNSQGKYKITVKYNGETTYTYDDTATTPVGISSDTKDKIKTLAVGDTVTLTADNFAIICSGFTNWTVTDETVVYRQSGSKSVPVVLPNGIYQMQVQYDGLHKDDDVVDSDRTGIVFNYINDVNGKGAPISYGDDYYLTQKRFDSVPRTFEAWVYIPGNVYSQRGGVIIGNYSNNVKDVFINFEIYNNGVPRLLMSKVSKNGNAISGEWIDYQFPSAAVKADTWTHVTIVYGTGNNHHQVYCYINGALKQKTAESAWHEIDNSFKDNVVCLGGDGRNLNDQAFRGTLSDVAIYSDVRTDEEIKVDFQGTPDLTDDALMMYYEISSDCQGKDIPDQSGNGYDMKHGTVWLTEEEVSAMREQTGKEYAYAIAFIPDTQYTTLNYPQNLAPIYNYLVDNAKTKNIKCAISLGDMTDTNTNAEWLLVRNYTDMLNGVIPYTVMRGNHDGFSANIERFDDTYAKKTGGYYEQILGNGGFYDEDSVKNTYLTFKAGSIDYIVLTLDFGADDNILAWADDVLTEFSDHRAIIVTHGYLNWDGTTLDANDQFAPTTYTNYAYGSDPNNGDDMWDELISKHENVEFVACGHIYSDNIVHSPAVGEKGNLVHQMLFDSQSFDNTLGGVGMVAMVYFTEDGNEAFVEYYSTVRNMYFRSTNQYAFTVAEQEITDEPSNGNDPTVKDPVGEDSTIDDTDTNDVTSEPQSSVDGTSNSGKLFDAFGCASSMTANGLAMFAIVISAAWGARKKRAEKN